MFMMNRCSLILFFGIFLCTGRGGTDKAQDLLNKLDLEEIVDKLGEFDLNQDGQLSEMEVEIQQPQIQKYLDRYEKLLKTEQDDEKDEKENSKKEQRNIFQKDSKKEQTEKQQETKPGSSQKAQQQGGSAQIDKTAQKDQPKSTETQHKQNTVNNKPDTQAKPPAVEDEDDGVEIEVVEELEFVEDDVTEDYSWVKIPAVVAGIAGVLTLFYVLWSRAKAERQVRQRQEEGQ